MNIMVIMPFTEGKYEDDTAMHCRALETYGKHTVIRVFPVITGFKIEKQYEVLIKRGEVDVIWAPYEELLERGLVIKKKLNKPLVGHFEILLPGRFRQDEVDMHWCFYEDPPDDKDPIYSFYHKYRKNANMLRQCDVRTVTGQYHKFRCEKALGLPIGETLIKPYPFDNLLYDNHIKENVKEKYQICTIYRLVLYKKTRHIIKALSLMKKPPKYIVAGDGEDKETLKKYAKDLGVDVEFRGYITDKEKVKLLQESMLSLSHYGWIPPTEAAYLKKPCICYYEPDTFERLKTLPYYVQCNDINALAEGIKTLLDNEKLRKKVGEEAYDKLVNNHTHTHLLKEDSKRLTKIFEEALK